MMANPKVGDRAQVWYNKRIAPTMHLHGKTGTIQVVSRGKPRNHGVIIDGRLWVVPCGNLRKLAP